MSTGEWAVMDQAEGEEQQGALIDVGTALTASDRAQIDIQITTAKRYPRDIVKSQKEAMALACMDEDTAGSMCYALPRKQKGKTVFIEGPSVRFAEVLVYCWGNIRAEARVVGIDETHVTAQGTCLDLEKNIGQRFEVKRRITDQYGKRYSEDMITMTGNAACAIAFRNAVFKVIPFALAKRIYDAARKTATGGALPIEARRQRALAWFARVGAPEARVLTLLDVENVDSITEEHLLLLVGIKNAIQEGTTTVESAFAHDNESSKAESRASDIDERAKAAATESSAGAGEPEKVEAKGKAKPKAAEKKAPAEAQTDLVSDTPVGTGEAATTTTNTGAADAFEGVRLLAMDMKPEGGDAPASLRDRIIGGANILLDADNPLRAKLIELAESENLGTRQASMLISRITIAVGALEQSES